MKDYSKIKEFNRRGGAYRMGSVDSWYLRPVNPHFYADENKRTPRIPEHKMTPDEVAAYKQGHQDGMIRGEHKEY